MTEQIYSASSIATFLRCGTQWEYAYVKAVKRPPKLRMVIGLAAHAAVEVNYAQKLETRVDLPTEDVLDAFATEFERLAVDVEPDEGEKPSEAKDSGILLVRHYQRDVAHKVMPLWVEKEVQIDVDGIQYNGWVDLVDEDRRVRDLKTVKRRPSDGGADYAMAMTGYALGYRAITGETEKDVTLDYMVRTKDPYYLEVSSGGPVTPKAIHNFASVLHNVDNAIRQGVFLPNGLHSFACSWCGYNDICPAFQASRR